MSDKGTSKKVTRVDSNETKSPTPPVDSKPFVVSDENKAKAKQFRFIAIAAWVLAIGAEIGAIFLLKKVPVPMLCTSGEKTTTKQIDNENGILNLK